MKLFFWFFDKWLAGRFVEAMRMSTNVDSFVK